MVDEFGRNVLLTIGIATAASLVKAVLLCVVTLVPASYMAYALSFRPATRWRRAIGFLSDLTETIPLLLWVLVAVVLLGEQRFRATLVIFAIAALPFSTKVLLAEFDRVATIDYVVGARALGIGRARLFFSYYLPEGYALLMPMTLALVGGALTLDGALGVLGLGNRMQLDLGTLLLRGKESFGTSPWLLIFSLISFVLVFVLIRISLNAILRIMGGSTAAADRR